MRGRRVTDAEALPVVREALLEVNRELCAAIGSRAVGLVGDEIGLCATPVPELGHVVRPYRAVLRRSSTRSQPGSSPLSRRSPRGR